MTKDIKCGDCTGINETCKLPIRKDDTGHWLLSYPHKQNYWPLGCDNEHARWLCDMLGSDLGHTVQLLTIKYECSVTHGEVKE